MGTNTNYKKIFNWIDSRLGLSHTILRPAEAYSLKPSYWLGGLAVLAFLIQAVTGSLMLLYYVPTVDGAYSSTMYIFGSVPLGQLLESIHLYGAYAMVLLAFAHLMRGYFASVHKKPRELMWVVGMLMGLVVLAFALTGYLLPWTVVSKSATDVTIGMLSFLPAELGPILKFLIAGAGSDAEELRRFFDLHVVVLPAALMLLVALKFYMFEVHGPAKPSSGSGDGGGRLPWFPGVLLYLTMVGSIFLGLLLVISAVFPLALPPKFTPQTAALSVPQPEWYFLWLYQILKFSAFEGSGIEYVLGMVTAVLLFLILLPFLDRGQERNPASRPIFITMGIAATAELVVLAVWGYLTPGKVIADSEALTVTLGTAAVIALLSSITFRAKRMFEARYEANQLNLNIAHSSPALSTAVLPPAKSMQSTSRGSSSGNRHPSILPLPLGGPGQFLRPAQERVRTWISFSILTFLIVVTAYLWFIDLMTQQRIFGILLGSELVAFSMLIYATVKPSFEKLSRPWILVGCLSLAILLLLTVTVQ
jgi:quinol-cytochrome oxidoreductase complex cytochrome b subunit